MASGRKLGVAQGLFHRTQAASAVRGRLGDVVGVAGGAVAGDLCEDVRPALLGARERLEHERAGAFTAHESVPTRVPRAAGALRIVVAAAEREHRGEPGDADGRNRGLGSARDHHAGATVADPASGFAQSMSAGGARAGVGEARPPQAKPDGHLACRHVRDQRGNEVRADLAGAFVLQHQRAAFQVLQATEAHADERAGLVPFLFLSSRLASSNAILVAAIAKVMKRVTSFSFFRCMNRRGRSSSPRRRSETRNVRPPRTA